MTDPFGHTIEPLTNTWEMMARIRSDDAGGALELLRRRWRLQVDPDSGYYTGTFWEFVLSNGLPSRGSDSLAHAWGAGPTQILTEAVLGSRAVDPGIQNLDHQTPDAEIELSPQGWRFENGRGRTNRGSDLESGVGGSRSLARDLCPLRVGS